MKKKKKKIRRLRTCPDDKTRNTKKHTSPENALFRRGHCTLFLRARNTEPINQRFHLEIDAHASFAALCCRHDEAHHIARLSCSHRHSHTLENRIGHLIVVSQVVARTRFHHHRLLQYDNISEQETIVQNKLEKSPVPQVLARPGLWPVRLPSCRHRV